MRGIGKGFVLIFILIMFISFLSLFMIESANAQGGSTTLADSLTVSVFPEVATFDINTSRNFVATANGGSGSFSYKWFLDGKLVGNNSPSYSYRASTGNHTIYVNVTDGANPLNWSTSNIVSISTNSLLIAPTIIGAWSTVTMDQGQTSNLTATTAENGTSPYSYQWLMKAPGESFYSPIIGANMTSYSFVTSGSTVTGLWSFELRVTDSATTPITVTSLSASFMVYAIPMVSIFPETAILNVGQALLFTANAGGGSGIYTSYQWYIDGVAQPGQTASTFYFLIISAGSYSITATVTDSTGATSSQFSVARITATISPTPTPTESPASTPTPTETPTPSPTVPEFRSWTILLLLTAMTGSGLLVHFKRQQH
jgi:hypothetical protein